jgi:hypothetical protein
MSIQKKSLINTLQYAKKANLAKGTASSDVSKSSAKASPILKAGHSVSAAAKRPSPAKMALSAKASYKKVAALKAPAVKN